MLTWLKTALSGAAVFILLLNSFQIVQVITRESKPYPILFSYDNDSSNAVIVLENTSWTKDNTWYDYGPLYYRVAHTLTGANPYAKLGNAETANYYTLMLTSFLAFLLIVALIAWEITGEFHGWILSCLALFVAFNVNPVWGHFLMRSKPDMLLALLAAVLTVVVARPTNRWRMHLCAIFSGLVLATKLNGLLLIPGVAAVLFLPVSKKSVREALKFGGITLATYLLVGLPQSLKIKPMLEANRRISNNFGGISLEYSLNLITSFLQQFLLPAVIVVLLVVFFGRKRDSVRSRWMWLIPGLPIGFFLANRMLVDPAHYLLCVVASAIVVCIIFLERFKGKAAKYSPWFAVFILCLSVPMPPTAAKDHLRRNPCSKEAEKMYEALLEVKNQGAIVRADPYVPYDRAAFTGTKIIFGATLDDLSDHDTLATNREFYGRYLGSGPPSAYVMIDHSHNWRQLREMYNILEKQVPFKDKKGRQWRRIFNSQQCGWQIWTARP